MQNFFIGFGIGSVLFIVIALLWFHGNLKPQLDALKQRVKDKL